jgi:hypothetical protein
MTATTATLAELREQYDEMLREACGDRDGYINIGILQYDVVSVFRSIDRIAYDIGLYEYIDAMGYVETDIEDVYELAEN